MNCRRVFSVAVVYGFLLIVRVFQMLLKKHYVINHRRLNTRYKVLVVVAGGCLTAGALLTVDNIVLGGRLTERS